MEFNDINFGALISQRDDKPRRFAAAARELSFPVRETAEGVSVAEQYSAADTAFYVILRADGVAGHKRRDK